VPTLSGIIKAGDEHVYSSSLLNRLHGHPGDPSLDTLYEVFAHQLRSRPVAERSAYASEITRFMASAKRAQRAQSVSVAPKAVAGQPEPPARSTSRKSVDLLRSSIDVSDLALSKARSVKKVSSATLVPILGRLPVEPDCPKAMHLYWDQEVQHPLTLDGRTATTVTSPELLALSLILGSPLSTEPSTQDNQSATQRGALGLSLSLTPANNGAYHVSLTPHKRNISQLPAKGSGYSPLFAKHLPSSSLPFSLGTKNLSTILITPSTLESLKLGINLHLQHTDASSPSARFLTSLPSSRTLNFHALVPSAAANSTSRLLHAISDLVFTGGLTPLASTPLVRTISFVASGGLPPGRLLQRLDALVEKVHVHAPQLQLFGPLLDDANAHLFYRANERLGKLAAAGGSVRSDDDEPMGEKAARVHRYVTLVERLVALVPESKNEPDRVRDAVREATRGEVERSYADAAATHQAATGTFGVPASAGSSDAAAAAAARVVVGGRKRRASGSVSPDARSGRPSSTFPKRNLGRAVEEVLKGGLPLDVQSIALVARLVLVAWTLSVQNVAWEENEEGIRIDGAAVGMQNKMFFV